MPGNVYYNGYMATRELLRAVERAGTTNNIKVIKELEGLKVSARDRMQHYDAYMNPATHQCSRRSTWRRTTTQPAEKDDIFKILAQAAAEGRRGPGRAGACKLETYEATPTYEQ